MARLVFAVFVAACLVSSAAHAQCTVNLQVTTPDSPNILRTEAKAYDSEDCTINSVWFELDGTRYGPQVSLDCGSGCKGSWANVSKMCMSPGAHTLQAFACTTAACTGSGKIVGNAYTFNVDSDIPPPNVTVKRNPSGSFKVTVDYAYPEHVNQYEVGIQLLPYIDDAGNITPMGAVDRKNPTTRTGQVVWDGLSAPGLPSITVKATVYSCGGSPSKAATATVPLGNPDDPDDDPEGNDGCPSGGGGLPGDGDPGGGTCPHPPTSSAAPVSYLDGNMRYSEVDPLPPIAGARLARHYDSHDRRRRLFGKSQHTFLDRRAIYNDLSKTLQITLSNAATLIFRGDADGPYTLSWPSNFTAVPRLTYVSGTYEYRPAGSSTIHRFRSSDGRYLGYQSAATGRQLTVAWNASGLPTTATDSWTGTTWTFTTDATQRRVTSIAVGSDTWTYEYDTNHNVKSVKVNGAVWRTYDYVSARMTASRDALGNAIETHAYDSSFRAIDSHAPSEEITSIVYGLAGPADIPGSTITRVTTAAGEVTDYVIASRGNQLRTVKVIGGCASCNGAGDSIHVYDSRGRIVREQHAGGYVTVKSYTGNSLAQVTTSMKPLGCDPETDASRCRFANPDALAAATLETTSATTMTTYVYGDPSWPERATEESTTSVLNLSGTRRQVVTYDPVTGIRLTSALFGWTGDPAVQQERRNTATFNNGTGAPFAPGGSFDSAWLSLPQPPQTMRVVDGPRGDVSDTTTYVYYPIDASVPGNLRGRLAAVRNGAGHVTRYEQYDLFGNATRIVDPNGVVTEVTTDALGRALTTTVKGIPGCDTTADPLCATDVTTTRTYTSAGGPLQWEESSGIRSESTYDSRGRVKTISRGAPGSAVERIEYGYDTAGQKSFERMLAFEQGTWVEKKREDYDYDSEGRLETITHPDATTMAYTYDVEGRLASTRDERHAQPNTTYAYDPAGRLKRVTQTLGAGTIDTSYTYDAHGNLTSVTDPNGNVTTYVYDDFGQMLRQTSPVTGVTTYAYDVAGNLTSTTDANGATTARTYDALGRALSAVSSRSGTPAETVTWTYDNTTAGQFGIGRLDTMSDPAGTTAYRYERRGLLRSETRTSILATVFTTSFRYDAAGNRTTITYPSGRVASYSYDFAGRPTALQAGGVSIVTSASYLPFGPPASIVYGNGTTRTSTFDTRYRMRSNKLTSGAGTIAEFAYTPDAAGNITSIADMVDPTYSRTFAYDDLNRLVTASTGTSLWGSGSYAYDAMGNMTTQTLGARALSFYYQGSTPKLTSVTENGTPSTVTYDAAGNETAAAGATMAYSARNHLTSTGNVVYRYDGRGVRVIAEVTCEGCGSAMASAPRTMLSSSTPARRPRRRRWPFFRARLQPVANTVGTSYKEFVYTPELNLLAETGHEYLWFAGAPIAQWDAATNTTSYTFTDHLGTPILQTDATATVTWRAELEPYGRVHAVRAGVTAHQPLRFPGQEAVGTEYYNIFRWYRAGWGRYTQGDPLDMIASRVHRNSNSLNTFGYADDNPTKFSDRVGLDIGGAVPGTYVKCFDKCAEEYNEAHNRCVRERRLSYAWCSEELAECLIIMPVLGQAMCAQRYRTCLRNTPQEFAWCSELATRHYSWCIAGCCGR